MFPRSSPASPYVTYLLRSAFCQAAQVGGRVFTLEGHTKGDGKVFRGKQHRTPAGRNACEACPEQGRRGCGAGTAHRATRESPRGEGDTGLAPLMGGSRVGSRRGSSYRWHSADNTTDKEGRSPGSRRVSTSPGAGDWRDPVNSWLATETPRGAGPHGQAGAGGVCACRGAALVREPDAGTPHVRFDERTWNP